MKRNVIKKGLINVWSSLGVWKYYVVGFLLIFAFFALLNVIENKKHENRMNQAKESAQIYKSKMNTFTPGEREYDYNIFSKFREIWRKYLTPDEDKDFEDLCVKISNTGATRDEEERVASYYEKIKSSANQEERKTIDEYEQYAAQLTGQRQSRTKEEQEFQQKLENAMKPYILKEGEKKPAHPTDEEWDEFTDLSDKAHEIYNKYFSAEESADFNQIGWKQTVEAATPDENRRAELYMKKQ